MKRRTTAAAYASLLLLLSLTAQGSAPPAARSGATPQAAATAPARQTQRPQPSPSPSSSPAQEATTDDDDEVVRITSNLVQIDAVVTDEKGNRVEDLRPEDFEVVVNKRAQEITNFSYVKDAPPDARAAGGDSKDAPAAAAVPVPVAPPKRPAQARRTVAFVVDNLCASIEDAHYARQSLRKFVSEEMRPDDVVAIIQTVGGTGTLQQFTSDKRLALAAVETVRFNSSSSRARLCGRSDLEPFEGDALALPPLPGQRTSDAEQKVADSVNDARRNIFSTGTLGVLNFIIKGLKEVPGRKSLVLLADNLPYCTPSSSDIDCPKLMEAYRRLTDLANRSSVLIYTVDLRGLPTLGITAADDIGGLRPQETRALLEGRRAAYFFSQEGMKFLAEETGGFFVNNTNDIAKGIRRVIEDQSGYYLIGFRPDENVFKALGGRARFNQFQLKVKRPGLRVRTRTGFYGYAERGEPPAARTRNGQLLAALSSPFGSGEIGVNLSSVFSAGPGERPFVSSLIHIEGAALKYTEEPGGWRQGVFDVMAVLFDASGRIVEEVSRTQTVRARGENFEHLMRDGMLFMMQVPVKKPGVYQSRVAVRDAGSEKVGAASRVVEVPDLAGGRLTLSGVVLQGSAAAAAGGPKQAGEQDSRAGVTDASSNAAVRKFRGGSEVEYYLNIYNARPDRATGRPRIRTQMRLFREGKPFYAGSPQALDATRQADPKSLTTGSRFNLGRDFPPGDYVLQVIVTDALAPDKHATATQWVDFQIVE